LSHTQADPPQYKSAWTFHEPTANHRYLLPGVLKALEMLDARRVLDIGCGNGALTGRLAVPGRQVMGADFAQSGVERAREAFPNLEFFVHDVTEPLASEMRGKFDVVVSTEVIEHLFLPRDLFVRAREALGDGGHVVITTPYHGYVKNLAIALAGKYDHHWMPLADFGHIKFFSRRTLAQMAQELGFQPVRWDRAGRIGPFAATMIMTAEIKGAPRGG
jgi:2-polyprenyl-3-methyl-5-hydroxy-6-metoxy-1,4-benzoquinol methylase